MGSFCLDGVAAQPTGDGSRDGWVRIGGAKKHICLVILEKDAFNEVLGVQF